MYLFLRDQNIREQATDEAQIVYLPSKPFPWQSEEQSPTAEGYQGVSAHEKKNIRKCTKCVHAAVIPYTVQRVQGQARES